MPDPFAAALDALFGAPGSVSAIYTPPIGQPVTVRAIRDNGRSLQNGDIIMDTEAVQIRRSELPNPVKGARVAFDEGVFTIQGPPQLDRERLTWTCPLQPA